MTNKDSFPPPGAGLKVRERLPRKLGRREGIIPGFIALVVLVAGMALGQILPLQSVNSDGSERPALRKHLPRKLSEVLLGDHLFRRVDGKVYNMSLSGTFITGTFDRLDTNGVAILRQGDVFIAVKNSDPDMAASVWPFLHPTEGKPMPTSIIALKTGVYRSGDTALDLYDLGELLPDEEEKAQMEAWERTQNENARLDAMVYAVGKEEVTNLQSFVWVSTNAAYGDAFSQFCLGEHYLYGEGCQTNYSLAIRWFKMAAAQGSLEASNQLNDLK